MNTELRDVTAGCNIRIDKDGKWFYDGNEIVNPTVLHAFWNALEMDDQKRYRIVLGTEVCYLEVEDTPFVISTIRDDGKNGIYLILNTTQEFKLDPAKIHIGKKNVMYTTLPDGIKVRFSRPAYYQLALLMKEDDSGNIVLITNGTSYTIYSPS